MTTMTFICAGFGPGVATAVVNKFALQGYQFALLSRSEQKLNDACTRLASAGVRAQGFPVDLCQPDAVVAKIDRVRQTFGPVGILFWNLGGSGRLCNPFNGSPSDFHREFNSCVVSLASAVNAARDDLRAVKGAVLVTGSGIGVDREDYTKMAVDRNVANIAVAKAAQRKLVDILHHSLKPDNVFVGECTILGAVRGTSPYHDDARITPEGVADELACLLRKRSMCFTSVE